MAPSAVNNDHLSPAAPKRPQPRRLSSMKAERADLFSGPTTIVPEDEMDAPGNAHETASAMEMAKHHLSDFASGETSPYDEATPSITTTPTTPETEEEEKGLLRTTGKYAFAFDIDGVLIRGGNVIPEAIDAMKVLNGENEYNIKV